MTIFATLKASLASLVRTVRGTLAAMRDERDQEMLAVVRVKIRRGMHARIDAHTQLFAALLMLFVISCAGLLLVAALLVVLLLQFSGIPIAQWETLLNHAPQELLPSLFAAPPETWSRIQIFFELEGALYVTFFILALLHTRTVLREFRWQRAFSGLRNSGLPPVPISRLMQISWPLSLHEVVEEPSPTELLDLVLRNHSLQVSDVITISTLESLQQDEEVTTRAILHLSHEVTITLQQSDGKQALVTLRERGRNSGWAKLLSYLADRPRGEWIHEDTLIEDVYDEVTGGKRTLLDIHRYRINEHIESVAVPMEISLPYNPDNDKELWLLFEQSGAYWRLSLSCDVVAMEQLVILYEQVKAIEKGIAAPDSLSLEDLIKRCDAVALEYDRGFLADHFERGYNMKHQGSSGIWEWARDPYIKYRNMWLFILEWAARRLRERAEQTDVTVDERAELKRQVTKCLGRSALATIMVLSEVERSAHALHQFLDLCREQLDYAAAEDLLQEYVDQLVQKPDFWKLPPQAEEILQETTELLEQMYEYRKRQKARRSGTKREAPGSADPAAETPRSYFDPRDMRPE
jgi:hypothetical protein